MRANIEQFPARQTERKGDQRNDDDTEVSHDTPAMMGVPVRAMKRRVPRRSPLFCIPAV
jgi:hypothetical protein